MIWAPVVLNTGREAARRSAVGSGVSKVSEAVRNAEAACGAKLFLSLTHSLRLSLFRAVSPSSTTQQRVSL